MMKHEETDSAVQAAPPIPDDRRDDGPSLIREAVQKLTLLLQGRIPDPVDPGKAADEDERELALVLDRLFTFVDQIHRFIVPLSKGELEDVPIPPPANFLASPFKALHSHMQHLTWQAQQVARGDYSQRVDFMGDFSEAFNSMIVSLDNRERQLRKKIEELESANEYIQDLEGILPICAHCKRIRREESDPEKEESWVQIESYISEKTRATFSHSICPECRRKFYGKFLDEDR